MTINLRPLSYALGAEVCDIDVSKPMSESLFGEIHPAPRNLPPDVLKKLNEETIRALRAQALKENLAIQGGQPVGSMPSEFSAFIKAEINRYAKVVRDAGISVE